MKTALVFFRNDKSPFDVNYYGKVVACFEDVGIDVTHVEMLSCKDDLAFMHTLERYKDSVDNLVVFDSDDLPFDIKGIIGNVFDTTMVENESARKFLDAVSKAQGKELEDRYSLMPLESTVIPNLNGAYQGFTFDSGEFTLAVFPTRLAELLPMCTAYLVPYLENKMGVKSSRLVLKYFGERTLLEDAIRDAIASFGEFHYTIKEECGDFTVYLNLKADKDGVNDIVRHIVGQLKDSIYAEFDTSLSARLFDLLSLKKQVLSVAESFTGGRVVSSMITNSGASAVLNEGVVTYSNDSKYSRLGVKQADLMKEGAVSAMVAYQMCAGLLKGGKCDIAIATTGIAGPKSDDSNKPVGLCYIAVGMKNGVHTYRYVFNGDREQITEKAKNTALFLAIKKLKNI